MRALRHVPTTAQPSMADDAVIDALPGLAAARLGPVERFVAGMIDGRRSIADVAALTALSTQETKSVCTYLIRRGLARVDSVELEIDERWDLGMEEAPPSSRAPTRRPPPR